MRAVPPSSSGSRPARARATTRADELRVSRTPDDVRTHRHDVHRGRVPGEGEQLRLRFRPCVLAARVPRVGGFGADTRECGAGVRDGRGGDLHEAGHARTLGRVEHGPRSLDIDRAELVRADPPARLWPRGEPTPSAPSVACATMRGSVIVPRMSVAPSTPDARRCSVRTSWPAETSSAATARPRNPEAPVTRTIMGRRAARRRGSGPPTPRAATCRSSSCAGCRWAGAERRARRREGCRCSRVPRG